MQFTLNRKRWRLVREPIRHKTAKGHRIYGQCSPPDVAGRSIRIDSRIKGEVELEVFLHELLHAAAWDVFDEEFVESTAIGMARLLWRVGYRKAN